MPEGIDGISLLPTLLGDPENQQQHDYLYWEFQQNQAVRHNDWFAHRKNGGQVELYDLEQDPQQRTTWPIKIPSLAPRFSLGCNSHISPAKSGRVRVNPTPLLLSGCNRQVFRSGPGTSTIKRWL